MEPNFTRMTRQDYDDILLTILKDERLETILAVPGVRDLLAREYDTIVRALWVNANYSLAYPEGGGVARLTSSPGASCP